MILKFLGFSGLTIDGKKNPQANYFLFKQKENHHIFFLLVGHLNAKSSLMSKERYEMLVATAKTLKENNDCVLKAFSLAMDIPYLDIREHFKGKRVKAGGVFPSVWEAEIEKLGFEKIQIPRSEWFGKTLRTFERNFKAHQKGYLRKTHLPFLIRVKGHLAALVNNELCDWTQGRCHRIEKVFQIKKKEEI